MATHTSILAWKNPWTKEPSGPQFMVSQRAGHDLATKQEQYYQVSSPKWSRAGGL